MTSSCRMLVATRYARIAGVLYLVVITCGIVSELAVRGQLVDFDSASATARHISDEQWLFRLGFAGDLVVFLSDVALAVLLSFSSARLSKVAPRLDFGIRREGPSCRERTGLRGRRRR